MRAWSIAAAILLAATQVVQAETYPSRQIRLVSGFPPGGVTDGIARIIAQEIQTRFGQSVVVENKPGASGGLAAMEVSRSAPDGYTLLVGGFGGPLIPSLVMEKYPLDATRELTLLAGVADFMNVVTVNSKLPVKSVQELIDYGKRNPGKLSFGSAGVGASNYLAAVLFMQRTGVEMVHVPSKGGFGPTTDLLSGSVDIVFENIPIMMGRDSSDALRMLAVTGPVRWTKFPNLPTMSEAGVSDYSITSWISIFGPPNMPQDLAKRISELLIEVSSTPDATEKMERIGFRPMKLTRDAFTKFYMDELSFWSGVVDKAGIRKP